MWTLPELQELLREAGYSTVTVYWEEVDEDDEGQHELEVLVPLALLPRLAAILRSDA